MWYGHKFSVLLVTLQIFFYQSLKMTGVHAYGVIWFSYDFIYNNIHIIYQLSLWHKTSILKVHYKTADED